MSEPKPENADMFERCLYFNTNALARALDRRWRAAFCRFNLSPAHAYVLRMVLHQPGLTQQKLAAAMKLEKSTMARFLDGLEKKTLIARRMADSDQRQKLILPTSRAVAIHDDLEKTGAELYGAMVAAMGAQNVKALVTLLRAAQNAL